jgi:hypothetical protein
MTTAAPVRIDELGPSKKGTYTTEHLAARGLVALQAVGAIPGGWLESCEGGTQDTRAGIDWMISQPDGTAYGVGIHVGRKDEWGTFSLRYRTAAGNLSELTKRARAIRNGGTYPPFTVQVYADPASGEVAQAYVASTRELWAHVVRLTPTSDDHFTLCCGKVMRNPDGSEYVAVAITEAARARLSLRSTLVGHGVQVATLRPATVGYGLGL